MGKTLGHFFWIFIFLFSCATETPDLMVEPGEQAGVYLLRPNSFWTGDSAAKYLAHGVVLVAQPGSPYQISFAQDPSAPAPKLRLYRLYTKADKMRYVNDQLVSPQAQSDRWVYDFSPQGSAQVLWLTVLEHKGERWTGAVQDLRYEGFGAYSDSLKINLWVAGRIGEFAQGKNIADFAQQLQLDLHKFYGPVGFKIGEIRLLNAAEHPQYGHLFPSRETVAAEDIEARFDSLNHGFDAAYTRALDFVLVDRFKEYGVLGLSPLYGFNLREGPGGVVLLAARGPNESGGMEALSVEAISKVAIHEMGHFFGLRHTTTANRDLLAYQDLSIYEDGLSDTPWCPTLERLSLGKTTQLSAALRRISGFPDYCPDSDNPMFPYMNDGEVTLFTPQQSKILLENLRLYP